MDEQLKKLDNGEPDLDSVLQLPEEFRGVPDDTPSSSERVVVNVRDLKRAAKYGGKRKVGDNNV